MAHPTFTVEMAFGNDPLDAAPTWVDVTTYVLAVQIARGRQYELDRIEAGTCDLEIEDDDRRFDPSNTASPYYPNVKPMVPVRVTVTHNATNYRRFYGFVEAWPQQWSGGGDPASTIFSIRAVDMFKLLQRKVLRSPYEIEVLVDNPLIYWRLDESGGALVAVDISGNERHGDFGIVSLDETPPFPDGGSAIRGDTGPGYSVLSQLSSGLQGPTDFSVECWHKVAAANQGTRMVAQGEEANLSWYLYAGLSTPTFSVRNRDSTADSVSISATGINYADDEWHHIVARFNSATPQLSGYLDAQGTATSTSADPFDFNNARIRARYNTGTVTEASAIDEVAIYDYVLPLARVQAHYDARTLRAGELSGARIGYILDQIGVAAGQRNIDPGLSKISGMQGGVTALDAMQDIADAENGVLFVAGNGVLTFFDREDRVTPPKSTPQATFGDGAGEVEYEELTLSYDDTRVVNDAAITAGGITARSEDATSQGDYGTRSFSQELPLDETQEAQDKAHWLVFTFKNPAIRCERVAFGPVHPDADWTALLSREISDRCRIIRRPPSGSAIQHDVFVESVEESYSRLEARIAFQLSPAGASDFWVLGDATNGVLDSTTKLGGAGY